MFGDSRGRTFLLIDFILRFWIVSDSRVVIEEFREIVWSLKNSWVLKKSCVTVSGLFVEKFVESLEIFVVNLWSFRQL